VLAATAELAAETNLTEQEQEQFIEAVRDVTHEGPRMSIAVLRIKKFTGMVGSPFRDALLDLIAKVAIEAAAKAIGI
jgi:hypothetical protein